MSSFPLGHTNRLSARGTTTHNTNHAIGNATPTDTRIYRTTAAGDPHKLRGLPAIGRSVQGAIPGTTPHR